jgi:hypothetical protein
LGHIRTLSEAIGQFTMHIAFSTAVLGFVLLATTAATSAVSLASFTPRILIPSKPCQDVYTSTIDGCTPDDFVKNGQNKNRCSNACAQGMAKIAEAVLKSCKDVDVPEASIIGVFQVGIGVQALCPDVSVITVSSGAASSTKPPPQSSAPAATSKAATATTTVAPPSSTLATSTTPASQSRTTESSSSSSQGITTDPNATSGATLSPSLAPPIASSSTQSSAVAQTTRAGPAQLSNAGSGGGSPFDIVAGASSHLRAVDSTMAALLAMVMAVMTWK